MPPPQRIPTTTIGGDGGGLEQHEYALHIAAGAHSKAIDRRQTQQGCGRDRPIADREAGDLAIVPAERDRHRRHPAGLGHQKKHPSIDERHRGMVGLTQIKILSARARQARRQLGPDEGTEQGKSSAQEPDAENQKRSVHAERDDVGIDEDTGADNAAHDDHGGVEYSEQLPRFDGIQESALGAAISRKTSRRTADGTGDHLTIGAHAEPAGSHNPPMHCPKTAVSASYR